jgi:hypothetical protein
MADAAPTLLDKLFAYRLSQAISTAATLGIADQLADGPRNIDELARATDTHWRTALA